MEIQWKVPLMLFGPIAKAMLNECDLGLSPLKLQGLPSFSPWEEIEP